MGKQASTPPPPDPAIQVNAEAAANRYNINSPFGTQQWTTGGNQVIGQDSNGAPQYGQQYTQNISLNPSEQRQFDTHNTIAEQLLNRASGQIPQTPNDPFKFNEFNYNKDGTPDFRGGQYSNPNFDLNGATPDAAKAQYTKIAGLLQPEFKKQDDTFEQRLANQGLPIGSAAYNDALRQHENNKNFALSNAALDATTQGGQMAANQYNMNTANAANTFNTNYGNNAGEFQLAQARRDAANARALSQYNTNAQGNIAARQQNYNELAALLGGQQLNPINAGGGGGNAPLDVAGAYAARNAQVAANANAQNQSNNALLSAIGGLGGAAITHSDERLKDDIEQVGELPGGEGIYDFRYKWEPEGTKHTGVMAQEIEQTNPDAVLTDEHGFKMVDYRKVIARAMAAA